MNSSSSGSSDSSSSSRSSGSFRSSGSSWNAIEQWVAGDQIQGGREYQEDSFAITLLTGERSAGDRLLLVLADGMGGHAGGDVASDTVVRAFWDGFRQAASEVAANLRAGVDAANAAVSAKQRADATLSDMGSTLVAALVRDGQLYWASVGDSLLWVCRNGRLDRLNEDHSMRPLLLDLVELGRMTEEEARHDPRIHQLRSAIAGEDIPLVEIAAEGYPLAAGDMVVLASDGLETVSEAEMAGLIAEHGDDAHTLGRVLLDAAAAAGVPGQDNTTVLVYRVGRKDQCLTATLAEMEAPTTRSAARHQHKNIHIHRGTFVPNTETPGVLNKLKNYMFGNGR